MTTSPQPAVTACDAQCGAPVLTDRPPKVITALPVMRLVTSANPPKYGKSVPLSEKVAWKLRWALIVAPFSVTVVSTLAPEPPQ